MKKMNPQKIIAIYPFNEKRHNIYDSTLKALSKYRLVENNFLKRKADPKLLSNPILKIFYHKFIRRFISRNDLKFKKEKEPICDLIFAFNQIPQTKQNYILDLEILTALSGYDYFRLNKKKIQAEFEKENCKAIIVWTNFSYDCLIKNLDCRKFKNKIHILPPTIYSNKLKKDYNRKNINLLFVSSLNNPFDFELKGGIIALEVYSRLIKKYPHLTFTIRSPIPSKIKKKHSKLKGINLVEKFLSREELNKLFLESDILLEPIPGITLILECMNFQIPVIISDFASIIDFVEENETGFVVNMPQINGDNKNKKEFLKNLGGNKEQEF